MAVLASPILEATPTQLQDQTWVGNPTKHGSRKVAVTPAYVTRLFIESQATNSLRHTTALRPFQRSEFGTGAAAPSEAQIQAVNYLIASLRKRLEEKTVQLGQLANQQSTTRSSSVLHTVLKIKEEAGAWVKFIEKIWSFYFELFGQRQTRFAEWLLAADRIALDCYRTTYTGLTIPRTIPSPPPFTYMETGITPSTIRRRIPYSQIGKLENPFPIVKLPYHRLVNVPTLGACHHEVSHNLQSDLALWKDVPIRIFKRLSAEKLPRNVALTYARWHKEMWADLCGMLLGGPALVPSLMDVVANTPRSIQNFNPLGVHPTPYLRVLLNLELMNRLGFPKEATAYHQLWEKMYPRQSITGIPKDMLKTFPRAAFLVVDTICFQSYPQLGNHSLARVIPFRPAHQAMIEEAGQRLAKGIDPGIIPERFLVGSARFALENKLADPAVINRNFYQAIGTH